MTAASSYFTKLVISALPWRPAPIKPIWILLFGLIPENPNTWLGIILNTADALVVFAMKFLRFKMAYFYSNIINLNQNISKNRLIKDVL